MRHIQKRRPQIRLNPLQLDPQISAQLCIQRAERLVHQENRRATHQRPPNRHPLHFAARQVGGLVVQLVRYAQNLGHLRHFAGNLGLGCAQYRTAQRKGQIFAHGQMRVKRILLEHHRDIPFGRTVAQDRAAIDRNIPGIGGFQPGNQPQGRGFARPGRPQQHNETAIGDVHGHIMDRDLRPKGFGNSGQPHIRHFATLRHSDRTAGHGRMWRRTG